MNASGNLSFHSALESLVLLFFPPHIYPYTKTVLFLLQTLNLAEIVDYAKYSYFGGSGLRNVYPLILAPVQASPRLGLNRLIAKQIKALILTPLFNKISNLKSS